MSMPEALRNHKLASASKADTAVLLCNAADEIERSERKLSVKSWGGSVDRQGGFFSQKEIDQREVW